MGAGRLAGGGHVDGVDSAGFANVDGPPSTARVRAPSMNIASCRVNIIAHTTLNLEPPCLLLLFTVC